MFADSRATATIRSNGLDTVAAVSTSDSDLHTSAHFEPSTDVAPFASSSEPADLTEEMQRKVYELVKARVVQSIGAGANWTIAFRTSSDTDTFFSDTMADMIAWDVAHQLISPTVPNRARLAS